ncbi:MAG: methyl-accepting chemotaxis sensory transducer [Chthoniobacteraceae bacterium]|nr:methyl-accepting chemotaxis sensory transducer [Chthoniobacteraceae bacterium]
MIIGLVLCSDFITARVDQKASKIDSDAAALQEKLLGTAQRIRFDMLQMSDALRGILMDPKNELEKKRKLDADADLEHAAEELRPLVSQLPQLLKALDAVAQYDKLTLNELENRVMEMIASDASAAGKFYTESYLPARRQQEKLVDAFVSESNAAGLAAVEQAHASSRWWRWAMYGSDGLVLLVCLGVGLSIAQLTTALKALLDRVQDSSVTVSTSMNEIAATSKEQQATASEIAATTAEIGATSKEISATARELVRTMDEVSEVAEHSATLAGSGQASLKEMEETMRLVMEAASSINAKLTVLSEKAGNIGQVITTITKVADQTNMLSLNAAIEAEKAGEYGRGFAVVATEIRRLADQTAVATYDIEQMVREIQSALSASVMGMDKFTEEVRLGRNGVGQVSLQLSQILMQVQALAPRVESVNEGMQAQTTGAEQISQALMQLTEAAQQTVESLRQSTLAISELNEAAGSLNTGVVRFRSQV